MLVKITSFVFDVFSETRRIQYSCSKEQIQDYNHMCVCVYIYICVFISEKLTGKGKLGRNEYIKGIKAEGRWLQAKYKTQ